MLFIIKRILVHFELKGTLVLIYIPQGRFPETDAQHIPTLGKQQEEALDLASANYLPF